MLAVILPVPLLVFAHTLAAAGLPAGLVQFIESTDREEVGALLKAGPLIDLMVPRGGADLIRRVQQEATMPVVAGGIGGGTVVAQGVSHLALHVGDPLCFIVQVVTQRADQQTVGVFNFAICHKDLPEDLVYAIVKAVMENNPRMVQGHAAAKETLPQNVDKNTFLPFHPGAVRYFEEKGLKIDSKLKG